MSERVREICAAMYQALKSVGCRCQHNVPYAGLKEPQFVTRQCARCRCLAEYEAAKLEGALQ